MWTGSCPHRKRSGDSFTTGSITLAVVPITSGFVPMGQTIAQGSTHRLDGCSRMGEVCHPAPPWWGLRGRVGPDASDTGCHAVQQIAGGRDDVASAARQVVDGRHRSRDPSSWCAAITTSITTAGTATTGAARSATAAARALFRSHLRSAP